MAQMGSRDGADGEQVGSRDGAVVRALASHQCVPGSIPRPGVICGLSLLLVLFLASRGFSPGTPVFPSPQKPTFPNSNSNLDYGQALYHELLARVIAQVLPVFDIKFNFTFLLLKLAPFHIAVHIYPGRLKTLLLQLRLASNPLNIYGLAYSSFVFLFILYSDKTPHSRTILRYIRN